MKKFLIMAVLALGAFSSVTWATDSISTSRTSSEAYAASSSYAASGAVATANGGDPVATATGGNPTANAAGGDVTFKDRLQIPSGSGNLGAVNTNNTVSHRYVEGNGVSFLFGAFSINGTRSKFDLPSFLIANPELTPRQELALCITSQDFKALRELENNKCPVISTTNDKPLGQ